MRISDWSSDVCSSDLIDLPDCGGGGETDRRQQIAPAVVGAFRDRAQTVDGEAQALGRVVGKAVHLVLDVPAQRLDRRCDRSRSEEHTSELQSLMRISYAVLCLKKKHK